MFSGLKKIQEHPNWYKRVRWGCQRQGQPSFFQRRVTWPEPMGPLVAVRRVTRASGEAGPCCKMSGVDGVQEHKKQHLELEAKIYTPTIILPQTRDVLRRWPGENLGILVHSSNTFFELQQ
uniref:Uncharacterized protein n=1 Tax=Molossus molossus TaxID=27622 RepID=A0A7J8IZN2_MOLMO|nr:hypothetical protein HJG59_010423 [Molossus molossus]